MNGIRRHAVRGLQAAVIASLLAACGGGGGSGNGNGNGAAAGPTAAGTIGPAGGEVAFADGRFRLAVPAGALAAPIAITVTELNAASVPQSLRSIGADRVYRLEPAGTQFAIPATATVELPASPGGAIAVMALESNGSGEFVQAQQVMLSPAGRTLTGNVPHFSHLVAKSVDSYSATLTLESRTIAVASAMVAHLTLAKTASEDNGILNRSRFSPPEGSSDIPSAGSRGPIAVGVNEPPPIGTGFDRGVARTVTGTYAGVCAEPGTGWVTYNGTVGNLFLDIFGQFLSGELAEIRIVITDDYACTEASPPSAIATGVFPLPFGMSGPDGLRVFKGPFANFGVGPFAAFAGAQGTVVADLLTGLAAINWTPGGASGAKLGQSLIGALPVRLPDDAAKAAFFGYGSGGVALTNYVEGIGGFGATMVGNGGVLDASTAAGATEARAFLTVGIQGLLFYAYDPASQLFGGRSGSVPPNAVDGQMVSGAWPKENGPVLILTRQASAGSASKLYSAPPNGGQATLLASIDSAQARRLRCIADEADAAAAVCFVTLFAGETRAFRFDPAATAPPTLLSIPTGAGSLGIDPVRLANGNVLAVVANFDANSLSVIETSPSGATLVGATTVPAPAGCVKPAHVSLFPDGDGHLKAVVTCHESNSYWVHRAS